MAKEIIEFCATDGVILDGYINKESKCKDKILIEVHGMGSNCFKKRESVIAKEVQKLNIDTICFNTRGSEIIKYVRFESGKRLMGGTAFEDVEDGFYDILGAIEYAIKLGYKSIYLQGHSLGATKVLYTYNKLRIQKAPQLKYIKAILLLSLVDIPDMVKTFGNPKFLEYAENKEKENKIFELMPKESFIHLISVKTFLKYAKYYKNFDFAKYSIENNEFEELNNIKIPVFMRWGDTEELIKKSAKEQVEFMREKIKNKQNDISYIEDSNHSYGGKEQQLSNEITRFLSNID